MKKSILLISILAILLSACTKDPEACFQANTSAGNKFASFSNCSIDAISYDWDFGDGTSSLAQSPNHTFANYGTYQVSLRVANKKGVTSTVTKTVILQAKEPQACFDASTTTGSKVAVFNNCSIDAISYEWDFGDGTTSLVQSPTHTYANYGSYQVSLRVANEEGVTDTETKTVILQANVPQACFNFTTTSSPRHFDFQNCSTDATTYAWDFGDGQTDNTANPSHFYNTIGDYTVTLVATGEGGSTTIQQTVSVNFQVNGYNVVSVEHSAGYFDKVGATLWYEGPGGFNFTEVGRDQWSVYLYDSNRDMRVQLDLYLREVKFAYNNAPYAFLYTITWAE